MPSSPPTLWIKIKQKLPGTLSSIFFADDALFFLKSNAPNCLALKEIIEVFCSASGQSINYEKSSVFFSSKTPVETMEAIAEVLSFPVSEEPGVYLRLPTLWGSSMRKTLAYVRERIRQKLEGWKAYFVSSRQGNSHKIGGHGSPILSNGNFSHAVTLCKAINSDIANFWWGYSASKLIIHFKSWNYFWKSKCAGGIGFKDLAVFNKALLAKQCWRLVKNPNSLWCHFLKGRYFENSSFVHAKKGRVLLGFGTDF